MSGLHREGEPAHAGPMARRNRTDRLIAILGAAVLVLGLAVAWRLTGGGEPPPEADSARAERQVRVERGEDWEVRFIQAGRGRVWCGYAGAPGGAPVAFVSRPQRILFGDDALPIEFAETRDRYCPDLPKRTA